jgi:hypothetical protein
MIPIQEQVGSQFNTGCLIFSHIQQGHWGKLVGHIYVNIPPRRLRCLGRVKISGTHMAVEIVGLGLSMLVFHVVVTILLGKG